MLQPSQSFKYRGMSLFAQDALRTHGADVHLVIASSGNAGIATACIANILGVRCTVFLPHGANQSTIDWLRREGAEVVVAGHYYLQALESAKKAAQSDPNA